MVTLAEEKVNATVVKILERHQKTEGALIPVLQEVQESFGYLPPEVLATCSQNLKIPLSEILGVATFYAQFHLEPHGRNIIRVCRGTACHVKGGKLVLKAVEKELGVKENQTTADMNFTLETVACLGTCFLAPVMMVDSSYFGKVNTKRVKSIIKT